MASETSNAINVKGKRLGWSEASEAALLELWPDRVVELRGQRKNGHVYAEMADELAKMGHAYTARDVQVKLQNFTQRYRKEKAAIGASGGSPSTWPQYGRVHQIIGGFKVNMFDEILFESINDDSISSDVQSTPAATSSPLPPLSPSPASSADPAKKNIDLKAAILQDFKDVSADIRSQFQKSQENEQKLLEIESKKAESLAKIAAENAEVKNALISFLNKN